MVTIVVIERQIRWIIISYFLGYVFPK